MPGKGVSCTERRRKKSKSRRLLRSATETAEGLRGGDAARRVLEALTTRHQLLNSCLHNAPSSSGHTHLPAPIQITQEYNGVRATRREVCSSSSSVTGHALVGLLLSALDPIRAQEFAHKSHGRHAPTPEPSRDTPTARDPRTCASSSSRFRFYHIAAPRAPEHIKLAQHKSSTLILYPHNAYHGLRTADEEPPPRGPRHPRPARERGPPGPPARARLPRGNGLHHYRPVSTARRMSKLTCIVNGRI